QLHVPHSHNRSNRHHGSPFHARIHACFSALVPRRSPAKYCHFLRWLYYLLYSQELNPLLPLFFTNSSTGNLVFDPSDICRLLSVLAAFLNLSWRNGAGAHRSPLEAAGTAAIARPVGGYQRYITPG